MTTNTLWRRARVFVIPGCVLVSAFAVLVLDGLRLRSSQLSEYALPTDRSARSLLEFMRKLSGSVQATDTFFASSNSKEVVSAIELAHAELESKRDSLNETEQREADFYHLCYAAGAITRGLTEASTEKVNELLSDARKYLASTSALGARENKVALHCILVLDSMALFDQEREFALWMQQQLAERTDTSTASAQELVRTIDSALSRLNMLGKSLNFQSHTVDGQPFDLESLRGKVTLLEFWGTNCRPCLADLPALKRIYAANKDRGFEIVGVCLNAAPARIKQFSGQHQLPWLQLCDDASASEDCNDRLSQHFGIQAVPASFLIDAEGKVVALGVHPLVADNRDLEQWLRKLLPAVSSH